MALPFEKTVFVKSATKQEEYPLSHEGPGRHLPEIAFVGRSNAGKSTLINFLCRNRRLVHVSKKPGKTQLINFFRIEGQLSIVDLPGYGYAKVPKAMSATWGPMIEEYLMKRDTLKLLILLLDARRIPNEMDIQMKEWIVHHQIPLLVVLTKSDKLKRNELTTQKKQILKTLSWENERVVCTSALKGDGRKELVSTITELLRE